MAFKMKGYTAFTQPDDGDDVKMTPEQKKEHEKKVFEYNKNVAKPLNPTQKNKIKNKLSKLNPNSKEYKELNTLLNLEKNK
tara:strand:+ start:2128 stop:2370 length:243 start_codon:yes stop_codon:yes gene_type:complete